MKSFKEKNPERWHKERKIYLDNLRNRISKLAYEIWEERGKPEGQSDHIWTLAEERFEKNRCNCVQMDSLGQSTNSDPESHAVSCRFVDDGNNIAYYSIYDMIDGNRLHQWCPKEKYAIGIGPIKDITKEEYEALLKKDLEKNKKAS